MTCDFMHGRDELFLIFISLCMKFKATDNDKVKEKSKMAAITL